MKNQGLYFLFYNKFFKSDIWKYIYNKQKHYVLTLMIYILTNAQKKDMMWTSTKKTILVPRGSFLTRFRKIQKDTGISMRKIRNGLNLLVNCRFLTRKTTHNLTMLSIIKYDDYQPTLEEKDTNKDTRQTQNRHKTDTQKDNRNNLDNNNNNIIKSNSSQYTNKNKVYNYSSEDCIDVFRKSTFSISPYKLDLFTALIDEYNPDIVFEALKRCVEQNNTKISYIRGTCNNIANGFTPKKKIKCKICSGKGFVPDGRGHDVKCIECSGKGFELK